MDSAEQSSGTTVVTTAPLARTEIPRPAKAGERSRSDCYWSGKVVIVTGGSSGLGRALAEAFARSGADVVVAARSIERLESAAVELRGFGTRVAAIAVDVTRQEQVDSLIEQTVAQFGRLDVLVNNVGRSTRGALADTSAEEFAALMDINFYSAVRCTRAALPHLIRNRGHLVNIGSLSGKSASRYVGAYSATKFALAAYTQQLRMELRGYGVHVMLVSSGPISREDAGRRYADKMDGLPERAAKPGAGVRISPVRPERLAAA